MASSTSGINHREHAKHNLEVYHHVRSDLKYIDWIITTAFYTALHFVEHKIFPFSIEIGGTKHKFNSIEEYAHFSGKRSKHATRLKAVKRELPKCKVAFKQLYDLSMTARYHQYQFSDVKEIDKKVNMWLNIIIKECDK